MQCHGFLFGLDAWLEFLPIQALYLNNASILKKFGPQYAGSLYAGIKYVLRKQFCTTVKETFAILKLSLVRHIFAEFACYVCLVYEL